MADLLLELFCEEIPARMQAKAEADLKKTVLEGLKSGGLGVGDGVVSMSGPRRLAVAVQGLAVRSEDVVEERKGPKVGAPEKAVEGFMRGAGLSDISEAEVRSDPKKGDFYVAAKTIPGRDAPNIIAELVPEIVRGFHWPKSMRTGTGDLRWVRPLQRIVCVFGGKVVPFEIDDLKSSNETEGHRVHGRGPFVVTGLDDYVSQLGGKGHVLLTRDERRAKIDADAKAVCEKAGLELVEDKGLLEEVTGLAEWPYVILGDMDEAFLELPPEVIQLSMRTHQKYFSVRDPKTGKLAPHFVVVANIEATDGGTAIAAGNRKVLSARLDDGRFFWENDKKTGLEVMASKLSTIKFKDELGSIADKVERVAALARELAPKVGADPDLAERAAKLAKADLVSEMVYEFPELQGVMGGYYAIDAGEHPSISVAIIDHYKPQGPSDDVPTDPVSIAVALADKLDTLVGFWAIDEKPTGSKDPFALRRAALGMVRIVLENVLRLRLKTESAYSAGILGSLSKAIDSRFEMVRIAVPDVDKGLRNAEAQLANDLLAFFADRLKQYLRDQGQRHDLIDAVFALGEDDLVLITKRVEALGAFLETEDGASLMAGYKRAANILKAEEKKDGTAFDGAVDEKLLDAKAEKALFKAITNATKDAETALKAEDFSAAMSALASLRGPVDAFFDGPDSVMVNADEASVRANRLNLLNMMRSAIGTVADFGKIEG
ncbi:MAG: glycine--tRNA ligase subunit beta [Pseudomonadota bacterium]